jgi:UDP-3-O-[3-hydroxymyristoyl] glucosamine N-acyltransferase
MFEIVGVGAHTSVKQVTELELHSRCSHELQQILKDEYFEQAPDIPQILGLGLIGQDPGYKFLTFLENVKFLPQALETDNISCVITSLPFKNLFDGSNKYVILSENPKYEYFNTYNKLGQIRLQTRKTNQISKDAKISLGASIATHDVKIHPGVIIEANATIYPKVEIKSGTMIRAGAVVGSPGFEYKRNQKHVIPVVHDGNTIVGEFAELGPGAVIGQGFFGKPTIIGDNTKTDNLVSVSHGSVIGDRVLIAAGAVIAGNTIVGQDSWIGPGSILSNGLTIGAGAFVTLGSHVFRDVNVGERVMGSPARSLPWGER